MTMRIVSTSIFFVLYFFGTLYSQNLVINPSFEEYSEVPWEYSQILLSSNWFAPRLHRMNTPDFYHKNAQYSKNINNVSVPNNYNGDQQPKTGDAYSGIMVGLQEVIGGEFSQELSKDKIYLVKFYVSLAEKSRSSTDNIGCFLSVEHIKPVYIKHYLYKKKNTNIYQYSSITLTQRVIYYR